MFSVGCQRKETMLNLGYPWGKATKTNSIIEITFNTYLLVTIHKSITDHVRYHLYINQENMKNKIIDTYFKTICLSNQCKKMIV